MKEKTTCFPTSKKSRKMIAIWIFCAVLCTFPTACSPQASVELESSATEEVQEIVIGGPPEPPAGEERPGLDELGGLQQIESDGSSLYYYENGERLSLTPSLEWITIQFRIEDVTEQNAALLNLRGFAATDQIQPLTDSGIMLVPLLSGISQETLLATINLLRIHSDLYSQVNPVFIVNDSVKAITNEILVTFSAQIPLEEINRINEEMNTTIREILDENTNTYVLEIDAECMSDALSTANSYYEQGFADAAIPLFMDIKN
jgi:uncharacterized protein (DUF2164 family)